MLEPKKAAFKFETFKIPSFSYEESQRNEDELNLSFNPSGVYDAKNGTYYLTIEFSGFHDDSVKNPVIRVKCVAEFRFSEPIQLSEIPPYFYSNTIPIVFPYLRAFLSTLSLQSNTGVIMLGLLNFTGMGEVLKKNTFEKNEQGKKTTKA